MDVLSDVLREVRLSSIIHGRLELSAPWGARITGGHHASFYVLLQGSAVMDVDGVDDVDGESRAEKKTGPLCLGAGDLVILPSGSGHVMRDSAETQPQPLSEILAASPRDKAGVLRHGGGGIATSMICGCFTFEGGVANPLISALPPLIFVPESRSEKSHWLAATVRFLAAESAAAEPGAQAMLSRLADMMFVHALRTYLADSARDQTGLAAGWLKALTDRNIGQAVALVHNQPAYPWTVKDLASRVGMSRSAFAARFSDLVGESPVAYLTRWRMHTAARLLRAERNVAEVAQAVGYETQQAFSKAFKRWAGVAPTAYQRRSEVQYAAS